MTFLFDGSEESLLEGLFRDSGSLSALAHPHRLPDVDPVEWHAVFLQRFEALGHPIDRGLLDELIEATHGQPLRMMAYAHHTSVRASLSPGSPVVAPTLRAGIEEGEASVSEMERSRDADGG